MSESMTHEQVAAAMKEFSQLDKFARLLVVTGLPRASPLEPVNAQEGAAFVRRLPRPTPRALAT